jgi:hypothetical protein
MVYEKVKYWQNGELFPTRFLDPDDDLAAIPRYVKSYMIVVIMQLIYARHGHVQKQILPKCVLYVQDILLIFPNMLTVYSGSLK